MPELPEVETTLRGLKPHIEEKIVQDVVIRCDKLRWPVPALKATLVGQRLLVLSRRGKYLLLQFDVGTLLIHLGMSGSLKLLTSSVPAKKHDHVDIVFSSTLILRYTDPRRFGAILWTLDNPQHHVLLKSLGVEPLEIGFTANFLFQIAKKRNSTIKSLIMNSHIIVGVGNIYATESLFGAGIHPACPAKLLTLQQCEALVDAIKKVLKRAIQHGGTTLKDFFNSEGKPGYFSQQLHVYGRQQQPCIVCQTIIESMRLGERSSAFCPYCQPWPECVPESTVQKYRK
jgi:formamidopyrimidine-DNA glycosylase